ncbi:MAG TPA: HAD family hydrolase [Anaerolinea sp.]|nr:HAD family hydrolase [Anaerolinea sp.]
MLPAIFFDRDGVIIENRDDYVRSWEDVALIPGALEALAIASSGRWKLVVISNQAGIGKGLISPSTADEINRRLVEIIQQHGGRIDGVYICPHTNQDHCECRKPRPGLILRAAHDLNINLSASLLIGDALSDIQAGQNAGLPRKILVKTGRGAEQSTLPQANLLKPFEIFPDLLTAIAKLTR